VSRSTNRRLSVPSVDLGASADIVEAVSNVDLGPRPDIVERLLKLPALSVEQGAVIGQVHPATVRRACAAGKLKAIRLSGSKLWRFTPAALLEWLGAGDRVV
jgi:hypothetical protein